MRELRELNFTIDGVEYTAYEKEYNRFDVYGGGRCMGVSIRIEFLDMVRHSQLNEGIKEKNMPVSKSQLTMF